MYTLTLHTSRPLILSTIALGLCLLGGFAAADSGHHWDYQGAEGPARWGDLDPRYVTCRTGISQSPIDIHDPVDADLPPLEIHYAAGGRDEINNGHSIQIDYEPGSSISLDGHVYALKQFHFHAPSENHIDDHAFPLEAHLVHADDEGNLAVIAVMFEVGAFNPTLAAAWEDMPERPNTHHPLPIRVSAAALLPPQHDYYRFDGSLTTPPCSEGVTWLVLKQRVTASREQIEHFTRVMGHPNNRPVQPLNGRVVSQ